MSFELDVAIRFNQIYLPGTPEPAVTPPVLSEGLGLFELADFGGTITDNFVLTDSVSVTRESSTELEDILILTDLASGELLRKSDFRHFEATVELSDAAVLVSTMD